MLNKLKLFLATTLNTEKEIVSPVDKEKEKSVEEKLLDAFDDYVISLGSSVPQKATYHLNELSRLLRGLNFNDYSLEVQSEMRKMIEVDIKIMISTYLSIPKAHAVSVVLENGRTAKDMLIENLSKMNNRIDFFYNQMVEEKSKFLLQKEKISKAVERKKDFFDL